MNNWIKHGQVLNFSGFEVEIRHCPGHCPGNVIFWFRDEKVCFVGDVIFRESIGRFDLPGGDFDLLEASISNHIYSLPDDTKLMSGHGPETTVSHEIKNNPFVRL